jgi:hypothetical protein
MTRSVIEDKNIRQTAKRANIHQIIMAFGEGYVSFPDVESFAAYVTVTGCS